MSASTNKSLKPEYTSLPAALICSLLAACSAPAPVGVPPSGPAGFSSLIYAGVGTGASRLEPDVEGADGITLDETVSIAGNLLIGIDTSQRTSVELQIADLGEAELSTGAQIGYRTGSVAFAGRAFNNRRGLNLFAKLGVGTLQSEDSSLPGVNVVTNNDFNLVTGLGVEYLFNGGAGVRLEYVGHDTDVQFAGLNFIYHFGADSQSTRTRPDLVETVPREQPGATIAANEATTQVATPIALQEPLEPVRPQVQPFPVQQPTAPQPLPPAPTTVISEPAVLVADPQPLSVPRAQAPVNSSPREITVAVPETTDNIMGFDVAVTLNTSEFIESSDPPAEPVTQQPAARTTAQPLEPAVEPEPAPLPVADTDADGIDDDFDTCEATPAGLPVGEDGCERYNGVVPGVGFEAGNTAITTAALSELNAVATDMQEYPQLKLELLVQAASGTGEEQLLARRRTLEVFRYLRSRGVNASRLRALPPVVSAGITNPGVILRSQAVR